MKAIVTLAGFIMAGMLAAILSVAGSIQFTGVNLSGAEFGETHLPGVYNTDYTYPNQTEVDYFRSKGMNIIRLPFRWERLQPALNGNLNSAELGRLNTFVSATTSKGMFVLLDPHNYARYYNTNVIGSAEAPISAFSNFWGRLAEVYRTNDHVIFGLMNEPHDMPTETWRDAANSAIAAIRMAGATNLIFVPGNGWTGAWTWYDNWYGTPNASVMLSIVDPIGNFAFEVHQYLDADGSGTSSECLSADIGSQRLSAFTGWCRTNGVRAFLGEFAGSTNSGCLQSLENLLAFVAANADVWQGWAFWAAGPWWGNYMFTLEPINGTTDRAQMNVLEKYVPIPAPALQLASATQFQFVASAGFLYQPQVCWDLAGGAWTNFGAAIPGTGQTAVVTMPAHSGVQLFFRINTTRAP